jgi:hypothetical protein
VNIHDPLVAWEAAIGRYCSADDLERDRVFSLSLRQFALFRRYASIGQATSQIRNELRLEALRAKRYAHLPSRLRGVFVFESLEDAQAAAKRWDGGHFDPSFLSEIEMVPSRSARLDSEWITFNLATENDPSWMDHYWRGEVSGTNPLTEVVCSGVGAILNKELRERAYRKVMEHFPKAVPLLSVACVAFYLGFTRVAQVVPYLLAAGPKVRGVHLLNMNDLRNESPLFAALPQYKDPWPPLARPWDGVIQVPDLSGSWFELEVSELSTLVAEVSVPPPADESVLDRIRSVHAARH